MIEPSDEAIHLITLSPIYFMIFHNSPEGQPLPMAVLLPFMGRGFCFGNVIKLPVL